MIGECPLIIKVPRGILHDPLPSTILILPILHAIPLIHSLRRLIHPHITPHINLLRGNLKPIVPPDRPHLIPKQNGLCRQHPVLFFRVFRKDHRVEHFFVFGLAGHHEGVVAVGHEIGLRVEVAAFWEGEVSVVFVRRVEGARTLW
jgi:hypothetical protein